MCISFVEIPQTVIISSFHNYIIWRNIITMLRLKRNFRNCLQNFSRPKIKEDMNFSISTGRKRRRTAKNGKPLMKHGQFGYVWSAISKTVFKIFLDQKSREIWIFQYLLAENGVGWPKTAKPLMKHGQIGYVWSAISKTVFKISSPKIKGDMKFLKTIECKFRKVVWVSESVSQSVSEWVSEWQSELYRSFASKNYLKL